jgi:hypothetical protein
MNIKEFVIGIAVIILTISAFVFGVSAFYFAPSYSDFCNERFYPVSLSRTDVCPPVCVEMYEISGEICIFNECGSGCGADGYSTFESLEKCEQILEERNCYKNYDAAMEKYSRNLFLIALPIGVILVAVGAALFALEAVGAGIMGGGVGIILYGVMGFWRFTQNWTKFLLTLAGLIFIIWFSYWMNKKSAKKK